jgi:histone acetyltransferase (RNA polymerase elongator complex component)
MKALIVPFFISHQGCPHKCVFCDQEKISGCGGYLPTADELLDKIVAYRASGRHKSVEVAFYGGTFTSLPRSVQEGLLLPLQPLIAGGQISTIRVSTRPDAIDPEITDFLLRMGVGTVELGVQSMDDDVLTLAGRGHIAAQTEMSCHILKRAEMIVGMQLMPGLPGDTPEKALASLDRILALGPDFLRIYPTLVIAGTRLASLHRTGRYTPLPLAGAIRLCKIMLHRALAVGVKVIRIGLQSTSELESSGTILAGPYHPAFRQLVESALCYDLLYMLSGAIPAILPVTVLCSPTRVSDITGQRQENLSRLLRERGVTVSSVKTDPTLTPLEIIIESGQGIKRGNIVHDLDYSVEGNHFDR